jgi:hypothetical protein
MLMSRRQFLIGSAATGGAIFSTGAYAGIIEPGYLLDVTEYRLSPPRWPRDFPLNIAVIADPHACEPYMGAARIERIVELTNSLRPDLVVLLGDFEGNYRFITKMVPSDTWAPLWAQCKAPLGVHSILGNHDWWFHLPRIRGSIEKARIPLMQNDGVRLVHRGKPFWLLGLGDQIAHIVGRGQFRGVDNLPATLAKITDDAPAILLVHEPDIFVKVPERVSLTLAGHTHGGQVRLFGYSPIVPSRYGNRFAYGHIVENGRHMIVSGGLGCSMLPVRFGVPPEIVMVRLCDAPGT